MKASAFSYARASSVANALELLAAYGDRAKVLSGGQSLLPAMNLRLISPELIVDIGELNELRGVVVEGDIIRIGALTRHVDLQRSLQVAAHAPLLTEAIAQVAKSLVGVSITPAVLSEASAALVEELDPQQDQQASASMRRHLAKVLMARGVAALLDRPDLNRGGSA